MSVSEEYNKQTRAYLSAMAACLLLFGCGQPTEHMLWERHYLCARDALKIGDYEREEALLRLALAESRSFPQSDPSALATMIDLAKNYMVRGKFAQAAELYHAIISLSEKLYGPLDPQVAEALAQLSIIDAELERFAEAESLIRKAGSIIEKSFGKRDSATVQYLYHLGELLFARGQLKQAAATLEESLRIQETSLGSEDMEIAPVLIQLGVTYAELQQDEKAQACLKRAQTLQVDEPTRVDLNLALAGWHMQFDHFLETQSYLEKALAICQQTKDPVSRRKIAAITGQLGLTLWSRGKVRDAQSIFKRAYELGLREYGPDHPALSSILSMLGGTCMNLRQYRDAERFYRRGLELAEKCPEEPSILSNALVNMGRLYVAKNQFGQAENYYERGLEIYKQERLQGKNTNPCDYIDKLLQCYNVEGKQTKSEACLIDLMHLEDRVQKEHPEIGATLHSYLILRLAQLYQEEKKYDKAEQICLQQLAKYKGLSKNAVEMLDPLLRLASIYWEQQRFKDVRPVLEHIIDITEENHLMAVQSFKIARNILGCADELAVVYEGEREYEKCLAIRQKALHWEMSQLDPYSSLVGPRIQDANQFVARMRFIHQEAVADRMFAFCKKEIRSRKK